MVPKILAEMQLALNKAVYAISKAAAALIKFNDYFRLFVSSSRVNKRIRHLAIHAKKKRIRKKNLRRIREILYEKERY